MTERIAVLTTGGTIDKVYFDANSEFEVGDSVMIELLAQARVTLDVTVLPLMRKDSLELTDDDRREICNAVADTPCERIVITHGTDTMTRTAAEIMAMPLAKTVVLTGAFAPARFAMTDAIFNVGLAMGAVQALSSGVYIAMSGQIFDADKVRKNRSAERFEPIPQ